MNLIEEAFVQETMLEDSHWVSLNVLFTKDSDQKQKEEGAYIESLKLDGGRYLY